MVNIKELKRKHIRKIVTFELEGETVNIEIYNLNHKEKAELFEALGSSININEEKLNVENGEVAEKVYRALTNLQFDTIDELMEVLQDPCYELTLVVQEVSSCLLEITKEQLVERMLQLENFEILEIAGKAMGRAMELENTYSNEKGDTIGEEGI